MTFLTGKFRSFIASIWRWALFLLFGIVFYLLAVYFNLFYLFGGMPDLRILENPESQLASEVITADAQTLGKYYLENRSPVDFDQISPNVIKALVATEDARFVKHSGIDPRSMFRVFKGLVSSDAGTTGGGSTLTQQLAKNLFETRSEKYKGGLGGVWKLGTIIAKTKEWILSIRLERNYTKQEIMTMYLNTVSFGNNTFGIRVAAKTYFQKEPWELSLTQAALLVGMLQNPSRYNPRSQKEELRLQALTRRNVVLGQMKKYGFLNDEEFAKNKIKSLGLNFKVEDHNSGSAPYFREFLRDWLKDWLKQYNKENGTDYDLYTDGLRIYVPLDSRMQKYAEEAALQNMKEQQAKFFNVFKARHSEPWIVKNGNDYKEDINYVKREARRSWRYIEMKQAGKDEATIWRVMNQKMKMRVFTYRGDRDTLLSPLDSIKHYHRYLRTGMVSMDPRSGDVKAWVGGINYKHFKFDMVAQGRRQPGSTFKPIVYATALENNIVTPCQTIVDQPVSIGNWTPKNSTGRYSYQPLTLRQALSKSVNSVSAYLMKQVGYPKVIEYAHKLGITSKIREDVTICLGSSEATVLEMVNTYCTFANGGKHVTPRFVTRIEDKDGKVLADFPVDEKEVISPDIAYKMLYIMRGAVEEGWGTASRLRTQYKLADNNDIGAKTGTTSDYVDAWFMGMTSNLVSGLWVGGPDNSVHFPDLATGQGARVALPAWGYYMSKLYKDPDLAGHDRAPYGRSKFLKPDGVDVNLGCGGLRLDSTSTYVRPKITDDETVLF